MDLGELGRDQQREQAEKAFENQAGLTGIYYKSLIDAGIPNDLAYQLVLDHSRLAWTKAFWPNAMPGFEE